MWLNAVPVAFLMENVLVLYGIRNGMADSAVAVLASFIHLTMPFMVFGRNLIARFGLAKAWGLGWALRYVSVLILLVAPWAAGVGRWAASGVIMLGAFGFALFRSLGAINSRPLIGEITTPEERGRYIYGNFARFTTVHLISMAAAIILMQTFDAVWVYQLIIAVGAVVGFIGAYVLTTIPESGETRSVADTPLLQSAQELFQDDVRRRTVWAFAAGFTSFMLVIPFATIAVKNGYGVPDHEALIFTLLVVAGGIISSLVNREISDHVGPRPLLVIYTGGFLAVALFWAFAPADLHALAAGFSFLLAGYCKTGLIVGLGHYLLSTTPGRHRLATTLFSEIAGGAAAGLAGSVFGGTLIGLLQGAGSGMEVYRWYFRIVAAGIFLLIFVMLRLRRVEDWKVPEVLGLVFSPRDVWALMTLNRLEDRSTARADLNDVARLRQTKSPLSQARLREYVYSPQLEVRMSALRALRNLDMDAQSLKVVQDQLETGEFTTAWLAADILGERGIRAATEPLRRSLYSDDPMLQGKAMVNLVRLGDEGRYPEIRTIFREVEHVRVIMYGSKAIARMGEIEDIPLILAKACNTILPGPVHDELMIAAATICGVGDAYYRLIRLHRHDAEEALAAGTAEILEGQSGGTAGRGRGARNAEGSTDSAAAAVSAFFEAWKRGDHAGALWQLRHYLSIRAEADGSPSARCARSLGDFLEEVDPGCVDARTALCLALIVSQSERLQGPDS